MTRRAIINPVLLETLGKTFRFKLIRTWNYFHATELIQKEETLPLKCVSVLGPYDLLLVHLGDCEQLFEIDTQPFVIESGAEIDPTRRPRTFTVTTILKFHRHGVLQTSLDIPPRDVLTELIEAAHGAESINDTLIQRWIDDGYVLGVEDAEPPDGQIETYMSIGITPSEPEEYTKAIFKRLVNEFLVPQSAVFSVYEGYGSANIQLLLRTVCPPVQLYALIELFHRKCAELDLSVHTNTYVVVGNKATRQYRNMLIPPLTDEQKKIRDFIIGPELNQKEQREFRVTPHGEQQMILESVRRIADGFRKLSLSLHTLSRTDVARLRSQAIRATVLGDLLEHRNVYTTLCGILESALRGRVAWILKTKFKNLEEAVTKGVVPRSAATKAVERYTFGEVKLIAESFQTHREETPYLPPPTELAKLHQIIERRNAFSHGQGSDVTPAELTTFLPDLLDYIRFEETLPHCDD
ncbi:MAG TPA: hypothetical protein VEK57_23345 [Thermoanaerobaculia bacterium]|nr:hypothetical protein [Thermoanaerobaculia bacterium]